MVWLPLAAAAVAGGLNAMIPNSESARDKKIKELLGQVGSMDVSGTSFSKNEVMNQMLPMVQGMYRNASNVAAGGIGSAIGEVGMNKGQDFASYYTQSLAPTIAEGENKAAGAQAQFMQMWASMDEASKQRMLQKAGIMGNLASSLSNDKQQGTLEKFLTGAISGAGLGSNAMGAIGQYQYLMGKNKPGSIGSGDGTAGSGLEALGG